MEKCVKPYHDTQWYTELSFNKYIKIKKWMRKNTKLKTEEKERERERVSKRHNKPNTMDVDFLFLIWTNQLLKGVQVQGDDIGRTWTHLLPQTQWGHSYLWNNFILKIELNAGWVVTTHWAKKKKKKKTTLKQIGEAGTLSP